MMKSAVLGVVLLNFILLLACTRVQVEILQTAGETKSRTPPDKEFNPGELGEQQLEQLGRRAGETSCATDRIVTRAVAQETGVWCWAASAEGVMSFHKVNLLQCLIVNKVKAEDATTEDGTPFCCENISDARCQQNGWTDEAFDSFGIDYRWLKGPLSQAQVAGQICGHGPFTYSIAYEGGGGHTLVVKDFWMDEEGMSLWVDTHEYFKDKDGKKHPTGFKNLSHKEYSEGSYDGIPNTVDFTYVLINPLQD